MKKFLLMLSVLYIGKGYAQEVNCADKLNEITTLSNEKEFAKATLLLKEIVKKCPAYSEKNYLIGIDVLQYNIDNSTEENLEKNVSDFAKLLDQYDLSFPSNKNGNLVKKAMTFYDNKIGEEKQVFIWLDNAFNKDKSQFTDANAMFIYFKLYYDQFLVKSNGSTNDLIDKYNEILFLIDENAKKIPNKSIDFRNATFAAKGIMKEYLIPENLLLYAENGFDKNASNSVWLEKTLQLLVDKLPSKAIFGKLAVAYNKLKPSSKSSYYLAEFNLKTNKINDGIKYLEEAINLSVSQIEKATFAYIAASVLVNFDKPKAKNMVQIAIDADTTNGKYFIFLASLYANSTSECAKTTEQSNAIYKLASSTVLKAGLVDANLKATSEQLSKKYLSSISNQKSKSVKIDCWINEVVQF
jgi:hypothetical protein